MPPKTSRQTGAMAMACLAIALLMPTAATAQTQSHTIYGSGGKVTGRTTTDSRGSTTFYGRDGRVTGRATVSGNTRTFYDADGRKTRTVTTTSRKSK